MFSALKRIVNNDAKNTSNEQSAQQQQQQRQPQQQQQQQANASQQASNAQTTINGMQSISQALQKKFSRGVNYNSKLI